MDCLTMTFAGKMMHIAPADGKPGGVDWEIQIGGRVIQGFTPGSNRDAWRDITTWGDEFLREGEGS